MTNIAVFTERSLPKSRKPSQDKPRERLVVDDPISVSLEATFYIESRRFDALREVLNGRRGEPVIGNKLVFSRWYPDQNVLIDLYNSDTDKNRAEANHKARIILEFNKQQKDPKNKFGYLPIMTGQKVPNSSFEKVLKRSVLDLAPRPSGMDRVIRECGIYVK